MVTPLPPAQRRSWYLLQLSPCWAAQTLLEGWAVSLWEDSCGRGQDQGEGRNRRSDSPLPPGSGQACCCEPSVSPPWVALLPSALPSLSFAARARDVHRWHVQLGELINKAPFYNLRAWFTRYSVRRIALYPEFKGKANDIALLQLASLVTYSSYVQPVCVLSSTAMFQHRPDCWTTGWGKILVNESEPGMSGLGRGGLCRRCPVLATAGTASWGALSFPLALTTATPHCSHPQCRHYAGQQPRWAAQKTS